MKRLSPRYAVATAGLMGLRSLPALSDPRADVRHTTRRTRLIVFVDLTRFAAQSQRIDDVEIADTLDAFYEHTPSVTYIRLEDRRVR